MKGKQQDRQILLRINEELKNQVEQDAASLGLSTSSYIRMLIIQNRKGGTS